MAPLEIYRVPEGSTLFGSVYGREFELPLAASLTRLRCHLLIPAFTIALMRRGSSLSLLQAIDSPLIFETWSSTLIVLTPGVLCRKRGKGAYLRLTLPSSIILCLTLAPRDDGEDDGETNVASLTVPSPPDPCPTRPRLCSSDD